MEVLYTSPATRPPVVAAALSAKILKDPIFKLLMNAFCTLFVADPRLPLPETAGVQLPIFVSVYRAVIASVSEPVQKCISEGIKP